MGRVKVPKKRCKETGKVKYRQADHAILATVEDERSGIFKAKPVAAYKCAYCNRYHATTHPRGTERLIVGVEEKD